MLQETDLVHESTLAGAVDSYLKELVHVRPFLLQRYAEILERMADCWLEEVGINQLSVLDPKWLAEFIATSTDRGVTMNALRDFCRWTTERQLVSHNPLGGFVS